jgi:hypothetical protein
LRIGAVGSHIAARLEVMMDRGGFQGLTFAESLAIIRAYHFARLSQLFGSSMRVIG